MNIKDNFDRLREADNWLLPNDETSAPTRTAFPGCLRSTSVLHRQSRPTFVASMARRWR